VTDEKTPWKLSYETAGWYRIITVPFISKFSSQSVQIKTARGGGGG
jgi:hypothetical protein